MCRTPLWPFVVGFLVVYLASASKLGLQTSDPTGFPVSEPFPENENQWRNDPRGTTSRKEKLLERDIQRIRGEAFCAAWELEAPTGFGRGTWC